MRVVLCLGVALWVMTARAQEIAVPDTPVAATITSYKIVAFSQEREPDWKFTIVYKDSNGKVYEDEHYGLSTVQGPEGPITRPEGADALMKFMNTANFATTSQIKRLLQHLVQHGKIPPSTVTGTPEIALVIPRQPQGIIGSNTDGAGPSR